MCNICAKWEWEQWVRKYLKKSYLKAGCRVSWHVAPIFSNTYQPIERFFLSSKKRRLSGSVERMRKRVGKQLNLLFVRCSANSSRSSLLLLASLEYSWPMNHLRRFPIFLKEDIGELAPKHLSSSLYLKSEWQI